MKIKSERELLYQQLELLAEDSKDTCPASNTLSQNSLAMAKISSELLKRKCFTAMYLITFCYLIMRLTVHGK